LLGRDQVRLMGLLTRIAITLGAAISAAVIAAIALALFEMDRVGHGKTSFTQMQLTSQMSMGDAVFLIAVLVAGVAAWWMSGRS
jgi:hypothetical protein